MLMYKKNQWDVLIDDVKAAIAFSRNQSLLRQQNLNLTRLPGSTEWSDGMMLFVDNPEHRYHSGSQVIHAWYWNKKNIHLDWKGFQSNQFLIFSSYLRKSTCNGHFLFTSPIHAPLELFVNRLGRVYIRYAQSNVPGDV